MKGPLLSVVPPLPWSAHVRRPAASLPFPFERGSVEMFARARQGLYEGIQQLGLLPGDVILVPAYHHGSEIEAYVRAGLTPRFYDVGDRLEPNESELDALLDDRVRVLHVTHYVGMAQDIERWRGWCDRRGVHLVEDAAQGWLGRTGGRALGQWGDLSLFSIYKTIPVPDGGAVVVHGVLLRPKSPGRSGVRAVAQKHLTSLVGRFAPARSLWALRWKSRTYVAEADFALGEPGRPATREASTLTPRLLSKPIAETRADHYRTLLEALGPWTAAPLRRDPEGASPYAFPVFVSNKVRAASLLFEEGIRAINAWSVTHPALPVGRFPGAARWRSGVLLLPVHQELRTPDLDRIVSAARSALGSPQ